MILKERGNLKTHQMMVLTSMRPIFSALLTIKWKWRSPMHLAVDNDLIKEREWRLHIYQVFGPHAVEVM
jgi:hypothetical protein